MARSTRGRRSRPNWSEMARIRSIRASWLSGSTWRMSRQTLSASSGSPSSRYRSAFFMASGIESLDRSRKAKDEGMLHLLGRGVSAGRRQCRTGRRLPQKAERPEERDPAELDNDGKKHHDPTGGPVALSVGDTIPNVKLMTLTAEGLKPVESSEVLGTGKVVLFAVPGAFTPTCSDHHLPGFVMQADEILAK